MGNLNFDEHNPVKIVKVRMVKDKKTGRIKGFYVRIPSKIARDIGLKGKEKAEVYANFDEKAIAYKISQES